MATGFHGLALKCSPADIIRDTTTAASRAVLCRAVFGDSYLEANTSMSFSNDWRDCGIFGAIASKMCSWGGAKASSTVYKHKVRRSRLDEEGDPKRPVAASTYRRTPKRRSPPAKGYPPGKGSPAALFGKALLNNVDRICAPGEMTALVGSSGAGKTTLLTSHDPFPATEGRCHNLSVNGTPLPSRCGLRGADGRSRRNGNDSRGVRIFRPLAPGPWNTARGEIGHLQHAVIGSLQLEQKKRTTIGVELCAKPRLLLFLDEPTSGLDSQGAYNTVSLLRKLSDEGQAVVCTSHQANQQVFELVDNVLALNRRGNAFYGGPVGTAGSALIRYFRKYGVEVGDSKNDRLIEVGTGVIASSKGEMDWNEVWKPPVPSSQRSETSANTEVVASSEFAASTRSCRQQSPNAIDRRNRSREPATTVTDATSAQPGGRFCACIGGRKRIPGGQWVKIQLCHGIPATSLFFSFCVVPVHRASLDTFCPPSTSLARSPSPQITTTQP
ncbi:P-loop containing nucleoside triphosphate hydrolase protein [Sphaerosporella brunnea]|uniref:P-loop containing nucleoside triphosphate hydrolase protein n=1 Tax=Sphaerosporella brunnea TaxID=1250544 RepID=A0A5J5EL40_9PEZI|nr:P-loop containing nucleoside triphosphate hydrolase protein [Sphaerosporella brunnea]